MKKRFFHSWMAVQKPPPKTIPTIVMLLLSGILLWSACKKDPHVVKGRITELGTGKPIEGAAVFLSGYTSSESKTLYTDTKGEFYHEYPSSGGYNYASVGKDKYYPETYIGVTTGVKDIQVALKPFAVFRVVTVPDMGTANELALGGDYLGAAGWEARAVLGTETHLFDTWGGRKASICWRPWGQLDETTCDSVYLTPHDTTTFTIHY